LHRPSGRIEKSLIHAFNAPIAAAAFIALVRREFSSLNRRESRSDFNLRESPMAPRITRRSALKITAAGVTLPWFATPRAAIADGEIETHGLSAFGDLALLPDFKHLG
jgi:hypothetical protein